MDQVEIQYARSDDVNIAYQVIGDGPMDVVLVQGWISSIEAAMELPSYVRFVDRLASFSRLILFDKRGTGSSDRVSIDKLPSLEQRMDDVRAVMDAVGSERAALIGSSEGGPMSMVFAATYPERTTGLVLFGTFTSARNPAYSANPERPRFRDLVTEELIEQSWGQGQGAALFAPSHAGDPEFVKWMARYERQGASPSAAIALMKMNREIDATHVLPSIQCPTFVLHRAGDRVVRVEAGRSLAESIPNAKYLELNGDDHMPFVGDVDPVVDEIQEFLTGVRPVPGADRVLATMLFTDIVGSTATTADVGDKRWKQLLDDYYSTARRELDRFRGREIKTTGDGLLATFDGPARGIRCAAAVNESALSLGIETRSGLHTGECELMGDDIAGLAVDIGARVSSEAKSGEVLVSSTVKDLVAGSGLEFDDRGPHTLKGVPGEWRLFALAGGT